MRPDWFPINDPSLGRAGKDLSLADDLMDMFAKKSPHPIDRVYVFVQGVMKSGPETEVAHMVMGFNRINSKWIKMYWVKTDEDAKFLDAEPDPALVSQLVQWGVRKDNMQLTGKDQAWHRVSERRLNPK